MKSYSSYGSSKTKLQQFPSYKATPTKGHPLMRLDFRWTEIVKYYMYYIVPLKRGHSSDKVIF